MVAFRRASVILVLAVMVAVVLSGCGGKKATTPPSAVKPGPTTTASASPISTSPPPATSKAPSPTTAVPPSLTSTTPSPTRPSSTSTPPASTASGAPPSLTFFPLEVAGLKVTVSGVTLPGTFGALIFKIGWEWGDGTSEEHWFPAAHSYAKGGEYTVRVTSYQNDGLTTTKSVTVVVQP
jgi:hypothetical protein